jgi:hypothetical protein
MTFQAITRSKKLPLKGRCIISPISSLSLMFSVSAHSTACLKPAGLESIPYTSNPSLARNTACRPSPNPRSSTLPMPSLLSLGSSETMNGSGSSQKTRPSSVCQMSSQAFMSYSLRLSRAIRPNPVMITPEILFTHRSQSGLNFVRNRPTPPLRVSHHSAEPRNTPSTNRLAEP